MSSIHTRMSYKKYRIENNCLNCGAVVEKKFCSECGQENLELKENFFHLVFHAIGDFFHFDSKFVRSIIPLFTRPGFLTKEYWEGKRVRYMHPLRLFFFVTIMMVIVVNTYYKRFEKDITDQTFYATDDKTQERKKLSEVDLSKISEKDKESIKNIKEGMDNFPYYLKYISFFLLPIYALGFYGLYRKKRPFYIDHIVYVLHLQSVVYISLTLLLLTTLYISESVGRWFDTVLITGMIIYLVISLRQLYRQSWILTLVKSFFSIILMFVISIATVASFIAVFII